MCLLSIEFKLNKNTAKIILKKQTIKNLLNPCLIDKLQILNIYFSKNNLNFGIHFKNCMSYT